MGELSYVGEQVRAISEIGVKQDKNEILYGKMVYGNKNVSINDFFPF